MVCVKSVENLIRPREKKGVRTSYYGISSLVESFSALFSWACTFHKHMPSLACWLPKVRALPHKILPRSRAFLQNLAEVGHEIWRFRPGHLEEAWRRASSKSCEKFPGSSSQPRSWAWRETADPSPDVGTWADTAAQTDSDLDIKKSKQLWVVSLCYWVVAHPKTELERWHVGCSMMLAYVSTVLRI